MSTCEQWPKLSLRRGEAGRQQKREIGLRLKPLYDEGGMSLRQLAAETGYTFAFVRACLKEAGVLLRKRGSFRRPSPVLSL